MKKAPVQEEAGEKAPLWIISFADMISLLMAFFVMLLTMAHEKSSKIANEGQGIFEATIAGFNKSSDSLGLRKVFGADNKKQGSPADSMSFDAHKTYYAIKEKETNTRTIDAAEERMRRVFNKLGNHVKTSRSQLSWGQPDFIVTPITFESGSFTLDQQSKSFLSKFITDLQEAGSDKVKLYIIGMALQEQNEEQQWTLSSRRADAVADFIRGNMPPGGMWSVYAWGTGTGGDWVVKDSANTGESIFIGVIKEK